jgi:hypothetical protein
MTVCVIVDRQDGSAPEYQKRKLATHQEGVRELISWLEECQGKTARNRGKRLEQGKTARGKRLSLRGKRLSLNCVILLGSFRDRLRNPQAELP